MRQMKGGGIRKEGNRATEIYLVMLRQTQKEDSWAPPGLTFRCSLNEERARKSLYHSQTDQRRKDTHNQCLRLCRLKRSMRGGITCRQGGQVILSQVLKEEGGAILRLFSLALPAVNRRNNSPSNYDRLGHVTAIRLVFRPDLKEDRCLEGRGENLVFFRN